KAIKGVPLHPTQLYESFAEAGIFIFLMTLRRHKVFDGQIMWTYVLLYSAARFIIEFVRGDRIRGFIYGDFSIAQGISVILFFVSIVFLVINRRRKS
ncbi:MAG: prolipoprotein diacylglyceryl transferase, partial [Candidatus Mariimomonas ferrooxydans]